MNSSKYSTPKNKRAASPRTINNTKSSKQKSDNEAPNFEVVLRDELISLKKMVLRHHANGMIHDKEDVEAYLDETAKESVMKDVTDTIKRLKHFKGNSNATDRVTGYIQAARKINLDLEKLVFTDERKTLVNMRQSNVTQESYSRNERDAMSSELAIQEQTINALATETTELLRKCEKLTQKNEFLAKELEKSRTDQMEKHESIVELRMQGIDFKSEVNSRCLKVLHSVQSRMGFVPSGIQKQILLLNVLKAPGDPAYDDIRCNGYNTLSEKSNTALEAELASLVPPVNMSIHFNSNSSPAKLPTPPVSPSPAISMVRPPSINCATATATAVPYILPEESETG